jgi:hypothetical protein
MRTRTATVSAIERRERLAPKGPKHVAGGDNPRTRDELNSPPAPKGRQHATIPFCRFAQGVSTSGNSTRSCATRDALSPLSGLKRWERVGRPGGSHPRLPARAPSGDAHSRSVSREQKCDKLRLSTSPDSAQASASRRDGMWPRLKTFRPASYAHNSARFRPNAPLPGSRQPAP